MYWSTYSVLVSYWISFVASVPNDLKLVAGQISILDEVMQQPCVV